MYHYARKACLGLAIGCLGLAGCGDAAPPAPAKTETPKPAAAEAPKTVSKAKKGVNPTADMDLKDVREFRRKQAESGKTP